MKRAPGATYHVSRWNGRRGPAQYDFGKQQQAVADALKLLTGNLTKLTDRMARWEAVQNWWPHMLSVIAVLKNEHFREEGEYRLVRVTHGWAKGICTRPATGGLVPYLPVKLDAKILDNPRYNPQNCGFEFIVIGPALHERQKTALDALLASQHMRIDKRKSAVPYASNR